MDFQAETDRVETPHEGIAGTEVPDHELERRSRDEGDALARDLLSLRHWRAGDTDAGLELLERYEVFFRKTCHRFGVRSQEDLEETYQEVVLDLQSHIDDIPNRVQTSFAGFYSWRIRNAIQRMRSKTRSEGVDTEEEGTTHDPDRLAAWESIERCWGKLPPREHEVFDLRFLREMSLKEVASAIGSNVNAVGQAIFRLSRKMRECLARAGFEEMGE